jgi:uridine kinase
MSEQNVLFSEQRIPLVGGYNEVMNLLPYTVEYAIGARLISPFERIIIGIAGGAGAGKSHLSQDILAKTKEYGSSIISMDRFYKDNVSEDLIRNELPEAIDFEFAKESLSRIKDYAAQTAAVPNFDMVTRKRISEEIIQCGRVVILDGPFFLYPEFNHFVNISIFVDALEAVRFQRRLARDVQLKGKPYAMIQQEWNTTTLPAYYKYIAVQRKFADIIVVNNDAKP